MLKQRKKAVTQVDIARAAGLSLGAVSEALISNPNSSIKIKPETRERVRKLAREMGYRHNRSAQMLRRGRSDMIGVVASHEHKQLCLSRLKEITAAIRHFGFSPYIIYNSRTPEEAVDHVLDSRVDGAVILAPLVRFTTKEIQPLLDYHVPIVALGQPYLKQHVPTLIADKRGGFAAITQHLVDEGYRNLALLISDSVPRRGGFDRICAIKGFEDTVKATASKGVVGHVHFHRQISGDEIDEHTEMSPFYWLGYLAAHSFAKSGKIPDAIVCQADTVAGGAIRAFTELGIRVPWDVAVTGFENDYSSSSGAIPITSAEQPLPEMSAAAINILTEIIRNDTPPKNRLQQFPCRVIVRHSSARHTIEPPKIQIPLDSLFTSSVKVE